MKISLSLLLILFLFINCSNNAKQGANENQTASDTAQTAAKSTAVPSSAVWVSFVGILPCADCSGLKTELTLDMNPSNPNPQFKLKETYLATKDGDQAHESQGVYTTLRGMKGNDDATIYQLNPDKPGEIMNYLKLNDSTLRTLDKEGNTIDSPMNMDLNRQK